MVGSTCAEGNKELISYGGRSKKTGLLKPTDELQLCDYFNGNVVLIPRFVFQKVGVNDPLFHHALGDFDYGLRAHKLGINSYIAPNYLGYCDTHENIATWCNPQKKILLRWKAFKSPIGQNPKEYFKFEYRHNGFILACYKYLSNYFRLLLPSIYNRIKKSN